MQYWTPSIDIFEVEVNQGVEKVIGRKSMIRREVGLGLCDVEAWRFERRLSGAIKFGRLPILDWVWVVVLMIWLLHSLLKDIAM